MTGIVTISKVIIPFAQNANDTIRFKNTGQERMWVRNKSSVTNLNTLAHISLLAVAVAAIINGADQSYRKLKTVKRIA